MAGILIGPAVFGLIKSQSLISTLSELGIAFLLFFIGLEFDISRIKKLKPVVFLVGALQVILITIIGTLVASIWFNIHTSLYLGAIAAFSSTMIVVKLILDKKEIDNLHGRIILSILLVQDIFAILFLPFLASKGTSIGIPYLIELILLIIILFLFVFLLQRHILHRIMRLIAENTEFLFIGSLAICFIFLGIAYFLNLPLAIGGFLVGLAIASQPYHIEVAGKIKPLKDFFAVLFFVSLGSQLIFSSLNSTILIFLLAMLILVVLIKPIITFLLLKAFRYSNRVSVLTSASLAQISEFSLVLAAQGLLLGHLSQDIFNGVILLSIFTIIITGYIIKYDETVFGFFSKTLMPLERLTSKEDLERVPSKLSDHTILFGADRMGAKITELYEHNKNKLIIVDFNPEIVKSFLHKGFNCVYGDYGNQEVLEILQMHKAKQVISTIPSVSENILVIDLVRSMNPKATIIVTARSVSEATTLYQGGADFVVLPEVLAGQKIQELIKHKRAKQMLKKQSEDFKKYRHDMD